MLRGLPNPPASEGDIKDVGSGRSPGGEHGNPSIRAYRITWTEEPDGLQSIRSQRVGHN